MEKADISLTIDRDIVNFAEVFAAKNHTSIEGIITQYLLSLKRCIEYLNTENFSSVFEQAMKESLIKLQTGTAVWHSYQEVFGE